MQSNKMNAQNKITVSQNNEADPETAVQTERQDGGVRSTTIDRSKI